MNRPLTLSPTGTPTAKQAGNPNARGSSRAARHPIPNLMNGRCPSFIPQSPTPAAAPAPCGAVAPLGWEYRRAGGFRPRLNNARAPISRTGFAAAVLGTYALAHIAQGWLMGAMA